MDGEISPVLIIVIISILFVLSWVAINEVAVNDIRNRLRSSIFVERTSIQRIVWKWRFLHYLDIIVAIVSTLVVYSITLNYLTCFVGASILSYVCFSVIRSRAMRSIDFK